MSEKENVLIISNSVIVHSGVGNQTAEIAKGLYNGGYGVYQIGIGGMEPNRKVLHKFESKEEIVIYTESIYDNVPLILRLINEHKIKCLILVNDPHNHIQTFINCRTIKNIVPIIYWNLWDTNLTTHAKSKVAHFNQWIYESCTSLPCISAQSENFVRNIINQLPENRRPKVSYVPHGSNENIFRPLDVPTTDNLRKQFFQGIEYDYVILFNSRNQGRKRPADLIYAFNLFTETLTPQQADKCALVMHTEPIAKPDAVGGTDLTAVARALAPTCRIYFDHVSRNQQDMNLLYNIADVTFNVSNAEGFGLSAQESLLAGTPIAATATGGLQDSIGFFDEVGNRIQFDKDFTSNNVGKYRNHGTWSYPLYPDCQTIIGSPITPFLFDDDVSHKTIKDGLTYWFNMNREERKARGLKGREWCLSQGMNATALSETFTKEVKSTISNFKKQGLFEIYKG